MLAEGQRPLQQLRLGRLICVLPHHHAWHIHPRPAATMDGVRELASTFVTEYRKTPAKLKVLDAFMVYALLTAAVQFGYMMLVGTFPFNSFLAGLLCCLAFFSLTGARWADDCAAHALTHARNKCPCVQRLPASSLPAVPPPASTSCLAHTRHCTVPPVPLPQLVCGCRTTRHARTLAESPQSEHTPTTCLPRWYCWPLPGTTWADLWLGCGCTHTHGCTGMRQAVMLATAAHITHAAPPQRGAVHAG